MLNIHLTVETAPPEAMLQPLRRHVRRFNEAQIGVYPARAFAVMANRADGELVGGVYGWLQWGWLFIDLAWVHADARGQGIGRALLQRFEALATVQGITRARLNTASFQKGLAFYQHCGYEVYATLEIETPDGQQHLDYFLKKSLKSKFSQCG